MSSVFERNLPFGVTQEELEHMFSGIGLVKQIDVSKEKREAQVIHPPRGPGQRGDEKESALQVAQAQVEALQMELEVQRDMGVKKQQRGATTIQDLTQNLQQTLDRLGQEETRVLVLQEENHRLVTQLDAILQEKQQQERDAQRLRNENETLASKVDDLMAQLTHARQQQEETEARYLDVSSTFNQVLEEKEEWMKAADSVESRSDAECVRNMETQLAEWKTEMAATTNEWALEKKSKQLYRARVKWSAPIQATRTSGKARGTSSPLRSGESTPVCKTGRV
ncbi:hypothetical protein PsorP6_015912 [Peronosclerospora sorghi]|uniref:Uncharacterized protein n=1 Tax=Peronosclerospora sorghi TaxID=230839 RepID=A0ACC0WQG9_9STRA|nr:hypothetical protein PsorP6_015912 [Peronosclerospora sorghi]